jgi:hypothetical protein
MRMTLVSLGAGMAALLGLAIAACGDDPPSPEKTVVSVCDAAAGEAPDGTVIMSGEIVPLNRLGAAASPGSLTGFVLTANGCSILVDTGDRSRVAGLSGKVTVRGEVGIRSELEAQRLRHTLSLEATTESIDEKVPSEVEIGPGSRFIDAYSVSVLPEG